MRISGKIAVERSRTELWDLLLDPRVLRQCVPGCEELKLIGEGLFRVKLKFGFGLLKGQIRGHVKLRDVVPDQGYRLEVDARGSTGFINGEISIHLSDLATGQGTELEYEGEGRAGGVLASVGARLFQSAARNFTEQFLARLTQAVSIREREFG